jgi:hypothetical protein
VLFRSEQCRNNPLYKDPKYCQQFANLHKNPEYYSKVHSKEVCDRISQTHQKLWKDLNFRERNTKYRRTEEFRNNSSKWSRKRWEDPKYREAYQKYRNSSEYHNKASTAAKLLWTKPEYRTKLCAVLNRARANSYPKTRISSLQKTLYSLLDDLKVPYFKEGKETVVGPFVTSHGKFEGYSFDCLVPNILGRKLYIECNGDYWHKDKEAKDRAKSTFLNRYCKDSALLVLWEHEFKSIERLKNILMQKLGLTTIQLINFDFRDVEVRIITKVDDELRNLLSKYHYLANLGRYGCNRYGVYYNGQLIAAAIFSSLTRNQSATQYNLLPSQMLELTRFCIHPSYQQKNFASWFLSRCTKLLFEDKLDLQRLITFADTTFEHKGTIYRASNWIYDGKIKPDYWYIDEVNCRYHKKTIWDQAQRMGLSEKEYAQQYSLQRIFGNEKLRFIYNRR